MPGLNQTVNALQKYFEITRKKLDSPLFFTIVSLVVGMCASAAEFTVVPVAEILKIFFYYPVNKLQYPTRDFC